MGGGVKIKKESNISQIQKAELLEITPRKKKTEARLREDTSK